MRFYGSKHDEKVGVADGLMKYVDGVEEILQKTKKENGASDDQKQNELQQQQQQQSATPPRQQQLSPPWCPGRRCSRLENL